MFGGIIGEKVWLGNGVSHNKVGDRVGGRVRVQKQAVKGDSHVGLLAKHAKHVPSLIHSTRTYLPMKMVQTECSERLACKIQTPGNYPKESIQQVVSF